MDPENIFDKLYARMVENPMVTITCVCIMLMIWLIRDGRVMGRHFTDNLLRIYQENTGNLIKLLNNTTQQLEATANSNENVVKELTEIRQLVQHCDNRQDAARNQARTPKGDA